MLLEGTAATDLKSNLPTNPPATKFLKKFPVSQIVELQLQSKQIVRSFIDINRLSRWMIYEIRVTIAECNKF